MSTHVYANGLEISSQAADGIASVAFPDPCWSPPAPPAGPVVIPYPNTARPKSLKNGSCTVFICGKPVALEDHSYFSTSTGNEAATQAFGKGVATGVIKGKAYHRSWSMDVMIEGRGVARHTDLMTHNHGSFPGNTPMFPYLSRSDRKRNCKEEDSRIKRACKPESTDSDTRKEIRSKSKIGSLLKKKRSKPENNGSEKKWHWTDDHCDGLHHKVRRHEDAKAYVDDLKEVFTNMPDELAALRQIEGMLEKMVVDAAKWAAGKWVAKAVIKQGAGSFVPLAGNVVMGLWSAWDAVSSIGDVREIRRVAQETLEQINVLYTELAALKNLAGRFNNFNNLTSQEILELATDGQGALATLNACTRARKCMLVPYTNKGGRGGRAEPANNGGCCPGQTGHHLIPDKMVVKQHNGQDNCPKYSKGDAPTVCVEGSTQHHGTHKLVHDRMDDAVADLVKQGKAPGGMISLDDAIDSAVKSHAEAFPLSGCSKKCIKAQLEGYYKNEKVCKKEAKIKSISKNGHPHAQAGGNQTNVT